MGTNLLMKSTRDNTRRRLTLSTTAAPSVAAGQTTVTPVAKTMALSCGRGVLVRSWPSAVLVVKQGRTSRVPIIDVTRLAQAAIVVAAVLCARRLLTQRIRLKERSS
jgi:hypothetical protein